MSCAPRGHTGRIMRLNRLSLTTRQCGAAAAVHRAGRPPSFELRARVRFLPFLLFVSFFRPFSRPLSPGFRPARSVDPDQPQAAVSEGRPYGRLLLGDGTMPKHLQAQRMDDVLGPSSLQPCSSCWNRCRSRRVGAPRARVCRCLPSPARLTARLPLEALAPGSRSISPFSLHIMLRNRVQRPTLRRRGARMPPPSFQLAGAQLSRLSPSSVHARLRR